jgi:hypothetical protein
MHEWHVMLSGMVVALAVVGCGTAEAGAGDDSRGASFVARRVRPPDLRWRDVADQRYSPAFTRCFRYARQVPRLALTWKDDARVPSGHLGVSRLKPNFAYQLKLVGRAGVYGPDEWDNLWDQQAWASCQLGRHGRWWCERCWWNTYDGDVSYHLRQGHKVVGYILFDWFVTDARGEAELDFAARSSHHVLWKTSQRSPGSRDSDPRTYELRRAAYGYGGTRRQRHDVVTLHAEWETGRCLPGQLVLPAGRYDVKLNLTEESFHSGSAGGGGSWAQVLEAPVSFTLAAPSAPGGLCGPASPWSALWRWLTRPWLSAEDAAGDLAEP